MTQTTGDGQRIPRRLELPLLVARCGGQSRVLDLWGKPGAKTCQYHWISLTCHVPPMGACLPVWSGPGRDTGGGFPTQ